MAWYNKYRPTTFEELVGQNLTKEILQNTIKSGKLKHAYLFTGTRGAGKTTTARIFANAVNEVDKNPQAALDIIEMDAASNTGIDDIRNLQESAAAPPIAGKYKFYILDEVHMLSKNAFNALLKILEEPPSYLIFILVTTNPEKLLPTVHSRVTKIDLGFHTQNDILERLKYITNKENVKIEDDALNLIAKKANGSQRDGITLLETISTYNLDNITKDDVYGILGLANEEVLKQSLDFFEDANLEKLKTLQSSFDKQNINSDAFLNQFLEYVLEQNFSSGFKYSPLILALTELLEKKLDLNNISSLFGVILARIKVIERNANIVNSDLKDRKEVFGVHSENFNAVKKSNLNSKINLNQTKGKLSESSEFKSSSNISVDTNLNLKNINFNQGNQNNSSGVSETISPPITFLNSLEPDASENDGYNNSNEEGVSDANKVLNQIKNLRTAPAILKMCRDLTAEFKNQTLVLRTNDKLYQKTLASESMKKYLVENFSNFGKINIVKIEVLGYEDKEQGVQGVEPLANNNVSDSSKNGARSFLNKFMSPGDSSKKNSDNIENDSSNNLMQKEAAENSISKQNNVNQSETYTENNSDLQSAGEVDITNLNIKSYKSGDIFYETYKQSKDVLTKKGVKVYTEKIVVPQENSLIKNFNNQKTVGADAHQSEDFDSLAEEIFDLE